MVRLVLVRHGKSQWNLENRFTGWVDVDLCEAGLAEARQAGQQLNQFGFQALECFTSVLSRAKLTLELICEELKDVKFLKPVVRDQALNERHYGNLQGMNKDEARKQFGDDLVHQWRRSYDVPPLGGESLKMTRERVIPYYLNMIEPVLQMGQDVLVVAHGNSLRSLVMHLEKLNPAEIIQVEIPTACPIIYEFKSKNGQLELLKKTVCNK